MIVRDIGIVVSAVGDILIGAAVLAVHEKMYKEHKVDASVLRSLERERLFVYTGFAFIIIGAVIQMVS